MSDLQTLTAQCDKEDSYMIKIYVINLWSVKKGQTQNWLEFTVTIGGLNDTRKFKLYFCGTELNGLSLSTKAVEKIRERFIADYHYPPYDVKKCKQILELNNNFTVEVEEV